MVASLGKGPVEKEGRRMRILSEMCGVACFDGQG
jgi:hypothetical protein